MNRVPAWLGLLALVVGTYVLILLSRGLDVDVSPNIAYSRFKALATQGAVAEVVLRGDSIEGRLKSEIALEEGGSPAGRFTTRVPAFGDSELLPTLEKQGVRIQVERETEGIWGSVFYFLPFIFLFGFWFWWLRRAAGTIAGGPPEGLGRFLYRGASQRVERVPDVRFEDVAGQENAKREVAELLDFLRTPEKYRQLGAEVPHGILLMGPPGTGKTLLARALAGEAQVPFFSISASGFIELFVGVGAARVRRLFDEAKKIAPSIIFIDELDSVGRIRGAGLGGGHDEREQTLNQILAEMDGFSGHEAVVVLAATNRPDVLDPALLRPGRFDRHITLDLPDRSARNEILRVHTQDVPLAGEVDLDQIAAAIPGFSGADIKNLVNEAAMMAAREGATRVHLRHFEEMRDRVIIGTVRTIAMTAEERHRLAIHEAGHTTVAHYLPNTDPLLKVTIIPRGRALGGTQQLQEAERYTLSEDYLRDRLALMLAGRSAERVVLGSVSSGADDDIREATRLARAMVGRWGMSDIVGPMDVRESEEHPFLGREIAQPRTMSEATAQAVDRAVRKLLTDAEQRAEEVIRGRRQAFDRLAAELERLETLDRKAIEECLGERRPASSAEPHRASMGKTNAEVAPEPV